MDSHSDMYAPRLAMHRNTPLKWDYKINMVGRKDPDPKIHNCEKCSFPVMSYGRMIPCKHVFCFDCAKATDKSCLRCDDPVQRIEQSPLGSIYLCTYGAPKHCHTGCRRTYLSQRDLQSHVNHRHMKIPIGQTTSSISGGKDQGHTSMSRMPDPRSDPRGEARHDSRSHQSYVSSHQDSYPQPPPVQTSHVMPEQMQYESRPSEATSSQSGQEEYHVQVPVRKSNLITVPLHDSSKDYQQPPQPQAHAAVAPYPSQAPIVPIQQHQAPPPPPPPQHVAYPPPHLPPVSVAHVPPISHPPPVSGAYTVSPISGHQVMHSMHPPPVSSYSQQSVPPSRLNPPHYDSAPTCRPPFPSTNPIPAPNAPFQAPGMPIPRPGWPVGPPPPNTNMPPPPQSSMPPPPPPSQVPPMVNPVPSMPPPQAPGQRPEMGPPPPPMGPPMTEAPRYHGQYFS